MTTQRYGAADGRRHDLVDSSPPKKSRANGHAALLNEAIRTLRHPSRPDPTDFLPLSAPVFHILLALAERDLHGYGIILSVEDSTDGKVRLRTGTLYTAVRRMSELGLIAEASQDADDRRRIYTLTPFGRAVARAESRRVASLASLARTRGLLARGARPRF